jgi:type II secretion system protein N
MESSQLIGTIVYPFKQVAFFHKKKLAFFIFSLVIFTLILFPYSDLTSFSKDKINASLKRSGSSVDYSKINFNLIPFGVQTSDFEFKTRSFKQPLEVDRITVRPSLLSFLRLQPGGTAVLDGLFDGTADITVALNGKTKEQTQKFVVGLDLEKISLAEIMEFQQLPYKIKGLIFGDLKLRGEDSFREQPKGTFNFNMRNVTIPSSINSPMGEIPLPQKVVWSNSNLFGKIENGQIVIEEGTLGTKKAPMNGRYKGSIKCTFNKSGPTCTDYNFKVELELNSEFQTKFAADIKPLLNARNVNIVSSAGGGARYLFSVQGNMAKRYPPPRFRSLNEF